MTNRNSDDMKLLTDCVNARRDSWDLFVQQYSKLIYHSINKTLHLYSQNLSQEDIEDIYNGTFLSLINNDYKKLRQFKGDCSLASWIKLLTVRFTIDFLRKQREHLSMNDDSDGTPALSDTLRDNRQSVPAQIESAETVRLFQEAIKSLPASDQLFMKLYFERELPVEEIAGIMNLSVNTIYSRKSRISNKMKKIFQERGIAGRNSE